MAKQREEELKQRNLTVEEQRKQQAALEALQKQIANLKHETDEKQRQKLIELQQEAERLKREQEALNIPQEPEKKSSSVFVYIAIAIVVLAVILKEKNKEKPTPQPKVEEVTKQSPTAKPVEIPKKTEQGKIFTNSIGMEFVLIPAGSFQMGSNEYDDEKPVHNVKIDKEFYLGKYEVTQKQYQAIMGNNPSHFKGENHPVEQVSWNDAQEFIKKLNEKEGKGNKYRLPSEAEWEYAARANTSTKWSFGDNESDLKNYAWYGANSDSKTHEVGQKKPNGFGLFDMHGNVWEWTCSDYEKYSESNHIKCLRYRNVNKSLRGGSWNSFADYCRSSSRNYFSDRNHYDGFRLVLSLFFHDS